jgi:hypothetical protein
MASFEKAAAVTQLTPHTYAANFPDEWCIGSGQELPLKSNKI